ncbi:MAG: 50S ribosomal protein L17 [Patescibacteria group bacterium]|nr:50S ribosomal protein L17 [Patescibacteria group bacterium]
MRHKIKKNKFGFGKDANKMLLRKLAVNFLKTGYLETTFKKAKVLKSFLEKLISKGKTFNEANKNYLLKYLSNLKLVNKIFEEIGPSFSNISGGYIKIIKKDFKDGNGSLIGRLEWAHPIIKKEKKILKKMKKLKIKKLI